MIGGSIISFTVSGDVVTFHVKEFESESTCKVRAVMCSSARKLIDIGATIWWTSNEIFLSIGDVTDCKFPKVGYSY